MYRPLFLLVALLALALAAPVAALAQDASPAASPMAGPCVAPDLPPGTPTPMDEATPAAAAEATPGVDEEQTAAETPEEDVPEPAPAGTPVSGADADAAQAGLENLVNCINGGDYLAAAALFTEDFRIRFLEIPNPYDVPATFEGVQPVEIRAVSETRAYDDGRVGVDWVYTGLFNGPGGLTSETWFFVEEDGVFRLDDIRPAPMPEGLLQGATVVDVQMVDFAFALDTATIPSGPVVFRTTNATSDGHPHVNVVVTLTEGTTAQQVISGEANVDEVFTGFYGAVFLEPGQSADLAFENLAPGTYFLVCDVPTEEGTPHFELGMVSEITVE